MIKLENVFLKSKFILVFSFVLMNSVILKKQGEFLNIQILTIFLILSNLLGLAQPLFSLLKIKLINVFKFSILLDLTYSFLLFYKNMSDLNIYYFLYIQFILFSISGILNINLNFELDSKISSLISKNKFKKYLETKYTVCNLARVLSLVISFFIIRFFSIETILYVSGFFILISQYFVLKVIKLCV